MTNARRRIRTDLSLRVSGVLSLAVAVIAVRTLARLYPQTGPLAFLLATIAFLCATAGSMLVVVGGHIYDPVRISARWRRAAR